MSSLLHLSSSFAIPLFQDPYFLSLPVRPSSKSHITFSFSSSNSNPIDHGSREEERWLREEQRWLREEQRWLREEQRWKEVRQGLTEEIDNLKLRLQELERLSSLPATSVSESLVANIGKLMQVLREGDSGKNVNRITESGSSAIPPVVEAAIKSEEVEVKEVISAPDRKVTSKTRMLRSGSEGDDVRVLQEALQKLGFYSGEEDMEFSSFSSGTERAVKTWQSAIGAREDGVMTAELLDRLYMEQEFGSSGHGLAKHGESKATDPKGENGAPVDSFTDISEVPKTITTKGGSEGSIYKPRVFLLGENRWEEPSRLSGSGVVPSNPGSGKAATKCLSCRGEGRVLCMECDGSGEPNVEPQFMEWVDEGTKCPYCEGLGYTACDVCQGENA